MRLFIDWFVFAIKALLFIVMIPLAVLFFVKGWKLPSFMDIFGRKDTAQAEVDEHERAIAGHAEEYERLREGREQNERRQQEQRQQRRQDIRETEKRNENDDLDDIADRINRRNGGV